MRLLKQSCEAFIQEPGLEGIYKQIERAGRTCYKSTDKITSESAKPFVDRMIKSNHTAMLEHGTVYLTVHKSISTDWSAGIRTRYKENKYSRVVNDNAGGIYITTNLRVIAENNYWDDLKYLSEPTEYHVKRYTLACTTALHCYKDLTRHRVFSFAIESTRYCNYTKDKFGNELAFIKPTWSECNLWEGDRVEEELYSKTEGTTIDEGILAWSNHTWEGLEDSGSYPDRVLINHLKACEDTYFELIKEGWQPQQAAEVLPQCVKGDMIITGFENDWKHLLDLRYYGTTGAPHPMVKELATLMKEELEKLGFNY